MIYLDENARVEKALYLEDDTGDIIELVPKSLELTGMGYQDSKNEHSLDCFFRDNSNYNKHVLVSKNEYLVYNVKDQRLEKWI